MYFKFRGQRVYLDLDNKSMRVSDRIYPINLELKPVLRKLYVKFNSSCNINCVYCYQNHDYRQNPIDNLDDYYKFLKKILNYFDEIYLFGGEPLLEENIKNILEFLEFIYPTTVNVYTNGYHTDKIKNIVLTNEQFKNIIITIDGTKDFHNKRRITNKYTYDYLINVVEMYKLSDKDVSIQINIDQNNNGDLINTLEYFNSRFSNTPRMNIILNRVLHTNYSYSQIDFMNYINGIGNLNKYENLNISINSNMLNKIIGILNEEGVSCNRCEAGNTWVLDFNTKDIYTCPEDKNLIIGKFNETNYCLNTRKIQAIQEYNNKHNDKCNECKYKYICSRGCFVANDLHVSNCKEMILDELRLTLNMLDNII